MATVAIPAEQRVRLDGISWQTYEALLRECDGRPIRFTYDRGSLEIMTLSHGHEYYAGLLGRLIETMTEELNIPIHLGGSTTFKKEAAERGLEPDECYWIAHEPQMRGKTEFDPDAAPPPDLAIEVDITSSSLNRMSIYATLGIAEVWRFDGVTFQVFQLARGKYRERDYSPAFPDLPLEEVLRFLRSVGTQDETSLVRSFRRWVREHLVTPTESESPPPRKRRPKK